MLANRAKRSFIPEMHQDTPTEVKSMKKHWTASQLLKSEFHGFGASSLPLRSPVQPAFQMRFCMLTMAPTKVLL